MFEFLRKNKQMPEESVAPEVPAGERVEEGVARVLAEAQAAKEARAKNEGQVRQKMRPEARAMYEQMIQEAKAKGDTKKQQIYEAALKELEKQISKDEEKKEE